MAHVPMDVVKGADTLQNASGTIAVGGTAQIALAADPYRTYLFIQNLDPSEVLFVNMTGTAANDVGIKLVGNAAVTFESNIIPTNAVSVWATTSAHKFAIWFV